MANNMLKAALDYAADGWPIFPARRDKTPHTINGVSDATTDEAQIRKWWAKWPNANIALDVGGAGMMVLDFDPGHDMGQLRDNLDGKLPATKLKATTPRGGEHWFYEIGRDELISPSASKLAYHVDVRSFHSYVLLAPSKTADGVYEWAEEGNPAYRSDEMVELANEAREKSLDRDKWIIDPDLPENMDAAIKWLREDAKIAIEGQGGDHTAYATAAMMRSYGISEDVAFDLMWEHWNPRCSPPWGSDEADHLENKIRNGYSYSTSQPGNCTPAFSAAKAREMFSPIQNTAIPTGREFQAGHFRAVDREGMEHIPPMEWLIKDFLPRDAFAMMFGAPGTFKTFLALDIGLSIATGFAINPVWPNIVKPGPVLYAAGEGRRGIKKRVTAWEKMHWGGERVNNFVLVDPVPHVSDDIEPFIEAARQFHPSYSLVVIDTVGRAMAGINENQQEHASKLSAMVNDIRYALGDCTVLCLHHTGHDGSRERGSSVFRADVDVLYSLERKGKDNFVELGMPKMKDSDEWERGKIIKLQEVQLEEDVTSLVAMTPSRDDQAEIKASSKNHPSDGVLEAERAVIERVVTEVLANNPAREYSHAKLSEIVACHEDIAITSSTLRQKKLKPLREDNGSAIAKFWDAEKQRWKHRT